MITTTAALIVAGVAKRAVPKPACNSGRRPGGLGWVGFSDCVFVLATVFASPKLGAGLFVAFDRDLFDGHVASLGQLRLDEFSTSIMPALAGIAGGLLMIAGVGLIAAF